MSPLTKRRALLCGADVLWLAAIFGQSLANADVSSQRSGLLTAALQWALGLLGLEYVPGLEHLLRKLAHFGEFFVLGLLAALTWQAFAARPPLHRPPAAPARAGYAAAPLALAGLLTALLDETLQLGSPGRTAQVTDVWLDWAGYLCGAALTALLLWRIYKVKPAVKSVESNNKL